MHIFVRAVPMVILALTLFWHVILVVGLLSVENAKL